MKKKHIFQALKISPKYGSTLSPKISQNGQNGLKNQPNLAPKHAPLPRLNKSSIINYQNIFHQLSLHDRKSKTLHKLSIQIMQLVT